LKTVQVRKRQIPAGAVRRASAVLLVALLVVMGATWLMLLEQDAPLESVVFEVVSAFSTTGLSLSYTSQLTSFGLFIIMVCMLWGRLGAMTVVAALGEQRPPERVEYPEERLLLG
jgi:trk system potassium uptake protein TrkH